MRLKKFIALALCTCICTVSVVAPSQRVYAITSADVDDAFNDIISQFDEALESQEAQIIEDLYLSDNWLLKLGTAIPVGALKVAGGMKALTEKIRDSGVIKKFKNFLDLFPNAKKKDYTINPEFVKEIYGITQDYIKAGGDDFFIMSGGNFSGDYPSVYSDVYSYLKMLLDNEKITLSSYSLAKQFISSKSSGIWGAQVFRAWESPSLNLNIYEFSLDYYYYLDSSGYLYYYDVNEEYSFNSSYLSYNLQGVLKGGDIPTYRGSYEFVPLAGENVYLYGSLRIFYNYSSLMNYLSGDRKIYYNSETFYNFDTTKNIVVNKTYVEKVNNTDWEQVSDDILKAISDEVKNSNALTDAEINKIIDDKFSEFINTFPDGSVDNSGNGGSDNTGNGGNTGGSGEVVVNEIVELLKISNEKLEEVIKGIDKTNKKLDSLVEEMTNLDVEVNNRGGFSAVLSGVFNQLDGVAKESQSKFPTSIPWDIILIVNRFTATPEVPYFEIPVKISSFNINEKIVIDLKDFDKVSKTSRSILSLTFCMFLLVLTRKMFFNDD